jgi:hypothetical protein
LKAAEISERRDVERLGALALMITTAAAPSLSGELLPAVTEPVALNTGFRAPSFSAVVSARTNSSLKKSRLGERAFPFSTTKRVRLHRHDLVVELASA